MPRVGCFRLVDTVVIHPPLAQHDAANRLPFLLMPADYRRNVPLRIRRRQKPRAFAVADAITGLPALIIFQPMNMVPEIAAAAWHDHQGGLCERVPVHECFCDVRIDATVRIDRRNSTVNRNHARWPGILPSCGKRFLAILFIRRDPTRAFFYPAPSAFCNAKHGKCPIARAADQPGSPPPECKSLLSSLHALLRF